MINEVQVPTKAYALPATRPFSFSFCVACRNNRSINRQRLRLGPVSVGAMLLQFMFSLPLLFAFTFPMARLPISLSLLLFTLPVTRPFPIFLPIPFTSVRFPLRFTNQFSTFFIICSRWRSLRGGCWNVAGSFRWGWTACQCLR